MKQLTDEVVLLVTKVLSLSAVHYETTGKSLMLADTNKALAALDAAQPVQVNEWKDAVTDALVVAHILTTENAIYPRKAVQDVIDWNCQVALDPRVSSKAQALVDSGKSVPEVNAMLVEALQAAEKLEHEALVALSEATHELKVGNTYTTATDTYKANNELIHRLDKILNSQYRDRKRTALTAAKQAQPAHPINCGTGHCSCIECPYEQAQPERAPLTCTWTQEDDFDMPGVYHTACGEMWSFTEGGIKENNTKFCPHCGGGIKQGGQQ